MRDFRELKVWERAHRLTLAIYKATSAFPKEEMFGLTSQMRRCSASIPANIAEGCGRSGNAELSRFLVMAQGSANELEYHLLLSRDLGLMGNPEHDHLASEVIEVKRVLVSYTQKLKADG